MFDNKRYMTRGIANRLPFEIAIKIWAWIDEKAEAHEEMDYLQVFELKSSSYEDGYKIIITHSQEAPEYQKEHVLMWHEAINGKIFVVDEENYSTMLWAEEY